MQSDGTLLIVSILLIAGAVGIWVKKAQLELSSGYLAIARFLGYSHEADLVFWQKLSFLRRDFAFQLLILLIVVALLRILPRVTRVPIAASLAILMCTIYFFELQALGSIGHYLSLDLVEDAIRWAVDFPESIGQYVSIGGAMKLVVAMAAISLLSVFAARRSRGERAGAFVQAIECVTPVVIAAAILLAMVAYAVPVPTLAPHRSALGIMWEALWPPRPSLVIPVNATPGDLMALYRKAAAIGIERPTADFAGHDAGHDLIVFVMETGPARCYDPIYDRESLPGVSALLDRSFVARLHFTTYPYTSDAVFSILTGLYPIGRSEFLRRARPSKGFGLVPPLRQLGYSGFVYLPYPDSFENDTRMYAVAGISSIYVAGDRDVERRARARARARQTIGMLPANSPARREHGALLEDRLIRDYMALDAMLGDILENKRNGRRFVALFMPQLGHAPWLNLYGRQSVVERGRDLMILQDAWLAEIIALLKQQGWLNDTVIAVTADHGIRTRAEDPALPSGTITNYSFQVPLVVYAPGSLNAMREIGERTSHIDIAPTLHALLGADTRVPSLTQGVPIWEARTLAKRKEFLFAGGYLGADAYMTGGRYVVRQALTGLVYESSSLPAPLDSVVPPTTAARLAEPIEMMYALQPRLLDALRGDVPP